MTTIPKYRALCFRRPIGPWRLDRNQARRDLLEADLGSYDEWGSFYVTVPGDLETQVETVNPAQLDRVA